MSLELLSSSEALLSQLVLIAAGALVHLLGEFPLLDQQALLLPLAALDLLSESGLVQKLFGTAVFFDG